MLMVGHQTVSGEKKQVSSHVTNSSSIVSSASFHCKHNLAIKHTLVLAPSYIAMLLRMHGSLSTSNEAPDSK